MNEFTVYLDIQGVLVSNGARTPYSQEFLAYVLERFPKTTYWLTSYCQGDASVPIAKFGKLFDEPTQAIMRMIKPTAWATTKTSAIDFASPFLWFDDNLFTEDKSVLSEHDALQNLILVDLKSHPQQLQEIILNFPTPHFHP